MAEQSPRGQSGAWARRAALRGLGAGMAVLLASCSTLVPRSAPTPPPSRPAPLPQPSQAAAPSGTLPVDEARHRVALLVPLTGPNGAVGQSIANAAALALADAGSKDIRITNYDTAPGAAVAARKAFADGNRLVLGPLLAEDVSAVSPIAAAVRVPVIAFSNDASVAGGNAWLLGFSPTQSIDRVVRYARSRGITRFAGLIPPGLYGRNASTALIRSVEAAGGSVVTMQNYDRTPKSIASAVQALSKQPYDAVLIADSGRIAIASTPAIRKLSGTGVRILGTELWNAERGLNAAPLMSGAWYASVDDTLFDQFVVRYRARYGRTPYRLASLGYDAVLLTARIARDWRPGAFFPADKLEDAGGFVGVDGAFRFGGGRIAERALAVHQIGGGATGTIISPAPKGF
ncbi:penicillin-binding protein activator [uncultured Sphingomonas sp.]|uniref:penicillin-binding protein activator n=1 Tax=uncultured Sphingomonas sp. TaxID=158754 RepID=UPI0025ED006A|nr:penicillin-binding protein activator [uncultured Sphingomonas sp.]